MDKEVSEFILLILNITLSIIKDYLHDTEMNTECQQILIVEQLAIS